MIRVLARAEPTTFDAEVRVPGNAWIAAHPASATPPDLWRRCLPDLRRAYKGLCAYFCCYVAPAIGGASADHFVPKSVVRSLTYEWSNYRFACARMNSRKRDASDVLDPFIIHDDWFELYFPTMRVRPRAGLVGTTLKEVKATLKRLKLNSEECRREREERWEDYRTHGLSAQRLMETAPFVAMEAARQGCLRPTDAAVTPASIRLWLDS